MIPYGRHDVDEADIAAVVEVLRGDWLTTGPAVEQFEENLKAWTGGVPVVAVSSGTAALHTAYAAAGIGPGDEVITPPITFIATQATAVMLGATVVFADVQADTGNIDPAAVEAVITSRTKAIVAVDYAGHPADMDELRDTADRHGLILIEDAAHSLGSSYRGRPVGSLADITAFSFFPTKNITTAEGGAVAVKDPQTLRRAREFARQGLVRDPARHRILDEGPWHQEVQSFGLNYRLPDLLAALGSRQLTRLESFKVRRAEIKALYDLKLAANTAVSIPMERCYVNPVWHLYPLRVLGGNRRVVFERLRALGVGVQVNYLPAYRHPAFEGRGLTGMDCPHAEQFYEQEISLPIHMGLTDSAVDDVASAVLSAVASEGW
jgi:dTDP-4-amino-4,6-dideoxygalactose transaminase